MLAVSPFGDFVVIASKTAVVLYMKKLRSGSDKQTFQIIRTYSRYKRVQKIVIFLVLYLAPTLYSST